MAKIISDSCRRKSFSKTRQPSLRLPEAYPPLSYKVSSFNSQLWWLPRGSYCARSQENVFTQVTRCSHVAHALDTSLDYGLSPTCTSSRSWLSASVVAPSASASLLPSLPATKHRVMGKEAFITWTRKIGSGNGRTLAQRCVRGGFSERNCH